MSAMRDAIAAELDNAVRNIQALAADAAMQALLEQAVGLCTGALRDGRKLWIDGEAIVAGKRFAEAEGLFIAIPYEEFGSLDPTS